MEVTARAPLPNYKTAPLLENMEKITLRKEVADRDEMREPRVSALCEPRPLGFDGECPGQCSVYCQIYHT